MSRVPSQTVSFRIPGALLARLSEEAEALCLSPGEFARQTVTRALQDAHRHDTLRELEAVRSEVNKLRADVASTLEMVLLNVANASEEDVRGWVTAHLREQRG